MARGVSDLAPPSAVRTAPSGARVPPMVRAARVRASHAEETLALMAPRICAVREALLTLEWTGRPATAPEMATVARLAHELAELGTIANIEGRVGL